jgi:hypothetical protein
LSRGRLVLAVALLALGGASALPVLAAALPPSIALVPNCGPARAPGTVALVYTIEVLGRGLAPGAAQVVFNPGSAQQVFDVTVSDSGTLDTTISPGRVPAGTYSVYVQDPAVEGPPIIEARTLFAVPCPPSPSPSPLPSPSVSRNPPRVLNPTITLTPALGPPGTVTVVRGTDFPANVPIELGWNQGIAGTPSGAIVTDGAGTFTGTVLIFPHDALGARVMTAVSVAPPNRGDVVGFASAVFLVVPGATQPRDFSWRR